MPRAKDVTNMRKPVLLTRCFAMGFLLTLLSASAAAQQTKHADVTSAASRPPGIASISVCSPNAPGVAGSCPSGTADTHQIVLAPDGSGNAINTFGVGATSDEHASVFSPGTLQGNSDYLFFVAAGTRLNVDIGLVVLSGGSGPDKNGQWTFDFPTADGYGSYPSGFGHIFIAPTAEGHCPMVLDGNPAHQDQTFDLGYAAPGSVVMDPTSGPGNLLMIYEGVNTCVGTVGGGKSGTAYISTGVATSLDYGRTWPTYRGTSSFDFVPLPAANKTQGPNAPAGALGSSVCMGNDCTSSSSVGYGRYPVLSPPVSLESAMATGQPLPSTMADTEPSAFVDDASSSSSPFVYLVHGYIPGELGDPPLPNNRKSDLMLARGRLNGGTAPLSFSKWNGRSFSSPGIGGLETPILQDGAFENCADQSQTRTMGSISYVDATQQYLLTFVCNSPRDPADSSSNHQGSAWFYSTSYDVSDPRQWTPPQEIIGSWGDWDNSNGCPDYKGWYPTLMSLDSKTGHLSISGYVFYMWGCLGGSSTGSPPKRQYSSRAFTITVPDFALVFDQSTITTSAPGKSPVTLNINRTAGFAGNVTLALISPLPAGVRLPGFPASTTGSSVSFKIKLKGRAQPGVYPIVLAGKDDSGRERDATLTLHIQ
jgi:hypothetical protein